MANKLNNFDKPLNIEYWAKMPIIVNGIKASNFYGAIACNSARTTER